MITREMMTEMVMGKLPAFIFTCKGKVQHIQNANGFGMVVATTGEAAQILAASMTASKGERVSVAEVGTIQGETLSNQIAISVCRLGATGVHATDDGKSLYYFKAPPAHDYQETV